MIIPVTLVLSRVLVPYLLYFPAVFEERTNEGNSSSRVATMIREPGERGPRRQGKVCSENIYEINRARGGYELGD